MKNRRTIGERLREMREALGFDQRTFGTEIGLPGRETISRWERGLAYPSADVLAVIHEKFGISTEWIVSGEGPMKGGETGKEGADICYIDEAVRLVDEAIRDAGVPVNEKLRLGLIEITREEMKKQSKKRIEGVLKVLGGKNE